MGVTDCWKFVAINSRMLFNLACDRDESEKKTPHSLICMTEGHSYPLFSTFLSYTQFTQMNTHTHTDLTWLSVVMRLMRCVCFASRSRSLIDDLSTEFSV